MIWILYAVLALLALILLLLAVAVIRTLLMPKKVAQSPGLRRKTGRYDPL